MALIRFIKLLFRRLFGKDKPPKETKTVLKYKDVLQYVEETPHLRNSLKKTKARMEQKQIAEANANKKKIAKKKAQKKARKKQRKK